MPWTKVLEFFETSAGIPIEEFRKCTALERVPGGYRLSCLNPSE